MSYGHLQGNSVSGSSYYSGQINYSATTDEDLDMRKAVIPRASMPSLPSSGSGSTGTAAYLNVSHGLNGGGVYSPETVVLEDATSLALELMDGADGFPNITKMFHNGVLLNPQAGIVVSSVLSIDEREFSSHSSVSDLVLALKGSIGLSRLRVRRQPGGAISVINITRPVKVYVPARFNAQQDAGYGQASKASAPRPQSASTRQYPAKAVMQWEYKATRDDELSAAAGETIIIVGEYKNPGWVWASRIGQNGQATGGYRLCPANYFLILQQHTSPWGAATSQLPTPGPIQPSQHHNTYQQLSSSIPSAIPSQSTAAGVKGVGDGTPSTAGDSTMFGAGSRPDMTAPLSGNFVCNKRIDVRRVPIYRYSMVLVTTCRVHVYVNAASDVICCHEIV